MQARVRRIALGAIALLIAGGLLAALSAAGGTRGSARPSSGDGTRLLVSLGDSVATGTQPDADGDDHGTEHGYADVLADRYGRALTTLGRGGETTASMLATGQQNAAVAFLRAHRRDDVLVTIAIGANDVERCSRGGAFPSACVEANLRAVRANLARILRQLRAAAGPRVSFVGVTYYDYFLAQWRNGAAGRALVRRAIPVEQRMNATIATAYHAAGIPVADVEDAFSTDDFTHTLHVPGFGTLPRAVARICQWTWSCRPQNGRTDDHPDSAGYRVIAHAIAAALARP